MTGAAGGSPVVTEGIRPDTGSFRRLPANLRPGPRFVPGPAGIFQTSLIPPDPGTLMALAKKTISLLDSAKDIVRSPPADGVLLLTETDMDWNEVYAHLKGRQVRRRSGLSTTGSSL